MGTVPIAVPIDHAAPLAKGLVEPRHTTCVNRIPCISPYYSDGNVGTDVEAVLMVMTPEERYEDLVPSVTEHHLYDVPGLERCEEDDVFESYVDWPKEYCRA